MSKEDALAQIRWEVSGAGLGLLLGAIAFWLVRPRHKATTALAMARRWLSWGLFAAMFSGTNYFFRHSGAGAVLGAAIGIVTFAVVSWSLGLLWGWFRFGRTHSPGLPVTPMTASSRNYVPIGAAILGVLALGFAGLSAYKHRNSAKSVSPAGNLSSASPADSIASKFFPTGSSSPDLQRILDAAKENDPDALYLVGLRLLFGDLSFLNPQTPGAYRPWGLGLPGEPPGLRDAQRGGLLVTDPSARADAVKFFLQAGEAGHGLSAVALYECYLTGIGTPGDAREASYWLDLAASTKHPEALFALATAPNQTPEAQFYLLDRLAESGHPAAQMFAAQQHASAVRASTKRLLGHKYGTLEKNRFGSYLPLAAKDVDRLPGLFVTLDFGNPSYSAEAARIEESHPEHVAQFQLLTASADQGYPPGQYEAASLFLDDPAQRQRGLGYAISAARSGYDPAIFALANLYQDSAYPFIDPFEALTWLYVARQLPSAPSWPRPDIAPEIAQAMKDRHREFQNSIDKLESQLTDSQKADAQSRAQEIFAAFDSSGGVWSKVSEHPYLFGS